MKRKRVTQLTVYGSLLALPGGGPVIETIITPAEECRLAAPCSYGDLWAPHGNDFDYGATPVIASKVAEASGGGEIGWLGRRRIPQWRRNDAATFHRYYQSQVQRKRKIAAVMMAQTQAAEQAATAC